MPFTTRRRGRLLGSLLATSLVASLGVLALPPTQSASAATYHTFEIENYTELDLTLSSTDQPSHLGWGTYPPANVNMGERRHFSVMYWIGYYDYSEIVYTFYDDDFSSQSLTLTTYRSPTADWSSCSTTSDNYTCTALPWTSQLNTRFAINSKTAKTEVVDPSNPSKVDHWYTLISRLCLTESLATCASDPSDLGHWSITLGSLSYDLKRPSFDPLPKGTRGQPYSATVRSPLTGMPGWTQTLSDAFGKSSGLPDGLSYDPTTQRVSGTPTQTGLTFVRATISANGVRIASWSLQFNVYTPPAPKVVTTSLASGRFNRPYSSYINVDLGGALQTDAKTTITGLPDGLRLGTSGQQPAIIGTPTEVGSFQVTINVTTKYGGTGTKTLPLVIK